MNVCYRPFHCWVQISLNPQHFPEKNFVINVVPQFNQKHLSHIGPAAVPNIKNAKFDNFYDTRYFYNAINSFVINTIYTEFKLKSKPSSTKNVNFSPFGRVLATADTLGREIRDVTAHFKRNSCNRLKDIFEYKVIKYGVNRNQPTNICPTIHITIAAISPTQTEHLFDVSILNSTNRKMSAKVSSAITIVNEWDDNLIDLCFSFKQLTINRGSSIDCHLK